MPRKPKAPKTPLTRVQKQLLNALEEAPANTNLNIRLPVDDLAKLQALADRLGVTKSKVMRAMIRQTADRVL